MNMKRSNAIRELKRQHGAENAAVGVLSAGTVLVKLTKSDGTRGTFRVTRNGNVSEVVSERDRGYRAGLDGERLIGSETAVFVAGHAAARHALSAAYSRYLDGLRTG